MKECIAYMANFNISFNRRMQTEPSLNRNAEKRHRGRLKETGEGQRKHNQFLNIDAFSCKKPK